MCIERQDVEDRLLKLRQQQAVVNDRIKAAKEELAALAIAIEESSFWLFEISKREAAAAQEA